MSFVKRTLLFFVLYVFLCVHALDVQTLYVYNPLPYEVSISSYSQPLFLDIPCPSGRVLNFRGTPPHNATYPGLSVHPGISTLKRTNDPNYGDVKLDVELSLLSETCSVNKFFDQAPGNLTFTYVTALINLPTTLYFYGAKGFSNQRFAVRTFEDPISQFQIDPPLSISIDNPTLAEVKLPNVFPSFSCPSGRVYSFLKLADGEHVVSPGLTTLSLASKDLSSFKLDIPTNSIVERCSFQIPSGISGKQLVFSFVPPISTVPRTDYYRFDQQTEQFLPQPIVPDGVIPIKNVQMSITNTASTTLTYVQPTLDITCLPGSAGEDSRTLQMVAGFNVKLYPGSTYFTASNCDVPGYIFRIKLNPVQQFTSCVMDLSNDLASVHFSFEAQEGAYDPVCFYSQ